MWIAKHQGKPMPMCFVALASTNIPASQPTGVSHHKAITQAFLFLNRKTWTTHTENYRKNIVIIILKMSFLADNDFNIFILPKMTKQILRKQQQQHHHHTTTKLSSCFDIDLLMVAFSIAKRLRLRTALHGISIALHYITTWLTD